MIIADNQFQVRLAQAEDDLWAAQRLRYEVFVAELGGDGPLVDHEARIEADEFDAYFDHLLLIDPQGPQELNGVVGVYRLLPDDKAMALGRYYSEDEYDLSALKSGGRKLLELGRSCLHRDYRGGMAMHQLWTGLADYVLTREIEVLFGVASFHGTDPAALKHPLAFLHHNHLAPPDLRVRALDAHYQPMDLLSADQVDRKSAMLNTPALIKAYLRLGGYVGDGAFIDHAFNTIDVCLVMDTARMNSKSRARYTKEQAG